VCWSPGEGVRLSCVVTPEDGEEEEEEEDVEE
jgi:hypothetical protein